MDKRKQAAAKEIVKHIEWSIQNYKNNTMYPAFGLDSRVEECQDIIGMIESLYELEHNPVPETENDE